MAAKPDDRRPIIQTSPDGGFAFVPGEVTVFGEAARDRGIALLSPDEEARERWPVIDRGTGWYRLRNVPDVLATVDRLRAEGFVAQPNHVFPAHGCCGGGCGCACGHGYPPHASHHHLGHPFSGTPFSGTPFSGTPFSGTPFSGTPFSGTPFSGTPFSGTPFSGTPFSGTRPPTSSARPAPAPVLPDRTLEGAGPHPVIAVIDSGLADPRPQPLAGNANISGDKDVPDDTIQLADGTVLANDGYLDPIAGHGTFIAGLIEGLAPGATIHVQARFEPLGTVDEATVCDAIREAVDGSGGRPPADIISLSLGGPVMEHPFELQDAIGDARAKGAVVVASAGNDGTCRPTFPAALEGVIAVAALGPHGPAPWSNHGDWVDACAPGTDLVSAFFRSFDGAMPEINGVDPDAFAGWAQWSGTSFAGPVVVAALTREMVAGNCDAREAVQRVVRAPHLFRIPCFGTVVNI